MIQFLKEYQSKLRVEGANLLNEIKAKEERRIEIFEDLRATDRMIEAYNNDNLLPVCKKSSLFVVNDGQALLDLIIFEDSFRKMVVEVDDPFSQFPILLTYFPFCKKENTWKEWFEDREQLWLFLTKEFSHLVNFINDMEEEQ